MYFNEPDSPLPVTQEMCDRSSKGLKNKMDKFFKYVLPNGTEISDTEIFRLDYLNTALEIIKNCEGFQEHIAEYKNDPESTFFVSVIADMLIGHGLIVKLEPTIPMQKKKPDIYAVQNPSGLGVYFECKQPKESTLSLLPEQRIMFEGIEDVISNEYSLAMFYERTLTIKEIEEMRILIKESFMRDKNICENRIIISDNKLGVKLLISGTSSNIAKNGSIEFAGIPNFSDEKGYSNANGINRYGKNVVFYKYYSKNTIDSQLKNSVGKVPEGTPYVICIDCSDSRFDFSKCSEYILRRFSLGDYKSFSGVLLIDHGVTTDGNYGVSSYFVENKYSKYPLPFLRKFFTESMVSNFNERYKHI